MSTYFLLILNVVLLLSVLALLGLLYSKMKRFKRLQDECVRLVNNESSNGWFRINVARPSYFSQRIKLLGFEAKGILINLADSVRIIAKFEQGETIDRTYRKSDMELKWLGNQGIGSSNMHWISLGRDGNELIVSADTGINAVPSREAAADICRIIAPEYPLPDIAESDFALEKNKASLIAVVAFFCLLAYALVDGVIFNRFELLASGPVVWGMALVAVLAIPCYLLLTKQRVPSRESIALSLLLIIAVALSYIPVMKRTDRWLAGNQSQRYAYVLVADAVLEPKANGLPVLRFPYAKEYWNQFATGSEHDFELIHGPLKLWQLDHEKLDRKVREFYGR